MTARQATKIALGAALAAVLILLAGHIAYQLGEWAGSN